MQAVVFGACKMWVASTSELAHKHTQRTCRQIMDNSGTGFSKESSGNAAGKTEAAGTAVGASAEKKQDSARQDITDANGVSGNAAAAGFDFNVDSLNLENLSGLAGLDFDVANLLRQVSSTGSGAVATGTESTAIFSGGLLGTTETAGEAATKRSQHPGSTSVAVMETMPGASTMGAARPSARPAANTQRAAQGSTAQVVSSSIDAPATTPGNTRPLGQGDITITPQQTSVRPVAARPAGPARPMRPVVGTAGTASPRPRPVRPPGTQAGQARPLMAGGGAGRPGLMRVGVPGARPRPVLGAGVSAGASGGRPGVRPGTRPRPMVRPTSAGTAAAIRSPTSGRPVAAVRPGMRPPLLRSPVQAGAGRSSSIEALPVVSPGAPVTPGGKSQNDQSMTPSLPRAASGARPMQQHGETLTSGGNAKGADGLSNNTTSDNAVSEVKAQAREPLPHSKTQTKAEVGTPTDPRADAGAEADFKMEAESEADADADVEEQSLTETVTVNCPRQQPVVHGLDGLYDVESTFRTLCHGSAPVSAEWSSQNIVAVSWPQLEPMTASRRVRRDGESEVTGDAGRVTETWRAASAEIHLYRLHVHTPAVWDSEELTQTIHPSLLRLCSLRMHQNGGVVEGGVVGDGSGDSADDAAEGGSKSSGAPVEGTTIDVAPLSEWHNGTAKGERMRVAAAVRSAWSADGRMLATSDAAGRFEVFRMGKELNTWRSEYCVAFDAPVVAWVWLGSTRKYGISRQAGGETGNEVEASDAWAADTGLSVRRLPFFGPRNTQGEYALVVATADGRLALVYQRDAAWERVVASLPAGHMDGARITHADMMLVSKKWIYLATHRAAAGPVAYAHEPGALPAARGQDGSITAPMAEVYGIQVEFEADYSPRLFATALAVAPVVVSEGDPTVCGSASDSLLKFSGGSLGEAESPGEQLCVTHLRLVTALDPEESHAENVLGERHSFPLVFVALGAGSATALQVLRLEAAVPTQRRGQALRLATEWTVRRRGVLVAAAANRAERQQLRRVFARRGDADHRALLLTWADGCVETLHDYGVGGRFDSSVEAADAGSCAWVAGGALSPHGTVFVQFSVHAHEEQPGGAWRQGRVQLRVGWAPFFGAAHVRAHSGDLLAVRVLNGEDTTDLVALLANEAAVEESIDATGADGTRDGGDVSVAEDQLGTAPPLLAPPASRTLTLALERACERLAAALRLQTLALDPLAGGAPHLRRLLGAAMQAHALAQHHVAASALGLVLHAAAAGEARVIIAQQYLLQSVSAEKWFSAEWRVAFPSATALVLWSLDLFAALARDAFVFLHVRCPDTSGTQRPLYELDAATAHAAAHGAQLPGRVPTRVALLFHQPTLDALRSMVSFASHIEYDLARRAQAVNALPAGAAHVPALATMVAARPLVVAAAEQLTHALAHLPVGLSRLKDFLADVHHLYAADTACTCVAAQAALLASATVTAPFARHLPSVARSFARFVLEPDVASARPPPLPSALVLHDSRWLAVAVCRPAAAGLRDGSAAFETPWRLSSHAVPASADAEHEDGCAAREKAEFERALDEDCVLFDVDDPGFIFVDPSAAPPPAFSGAFAHAAASAAAAAPVRIAAAPPAAPSAAPPHILSDADADLMFSVPLLFDAPFRPVAQAAAECSARVPSPSPRAALRDALHVVPHYAVAPRDAGWLFVSSPRNPRLHAPALLARHTLALAALHPPPAMAYCIDWARAAGVVISSSPALPTALPRLRAAYGVDHVDVVQKTLLPVDAPAKMCLRCGHATRRPSVAAPDAAEWVCRFDVLCVCGGSWVAI
ncbi:hypothetical protein COEREDRAFT_14639 [Coemansia reversa NRRL 1564]|uniref:Mediator complex subunit 16 n=1 Tax=Coemansia reversa (strain ATCC 12441 / NRRL 1564) TaxID=763665 RepID=A0A2G5BES0_COERN|nr:hypothetical protein COEREDRAFT_14639 [Coemansia reversa NRRL 1564]|eukprot:PIA17515.1 hypothetical protein COEREDRAFT_14639 [Coemansia reversa NRRL 1564]